MDITVKLPDFLCFCGFGELDAADIEGYQLVAEAMFFGYAGKVLGGDNCKPMFPAGRTAAWPMNKSSCPRLHNICVAIIQQ